jgi:catechol 2,3-dioxygenase-like lactoylglutathione lyase family enzyme
MQIERATPTYGKSTPLRLCRISKTSKNKPNSICVGIVNGTVASPPKSGPRYPDFAISRTRRYWSQASEWVSTGPALKSGAYAMNDDLRQTTPRPILHSIEAHLFVADIKSSCDFYTKKLGFAVEFIYGDPPYYGQVSRDNARLNLRLVCEPVFAGDIRKREQLLSASITVATANEIKLLFLSYQAAGVPFHQALKTEPWGARTFVVLDPDENLILFAGPAAD